MKTDQLVNRHVGITEADEQLMLQKIGVKSLDELIEKTIPSDIRLSQPLSLPKAMTEYEFAKHITELATMNKLYTSYIYVGEPGVVHFLYALSVGGISRAFRGSYEFPDCCQRPYRLASGQLFTA